MLGLGLLLAAASGWAALYSASLMAIACIWVRMAALFTLPLLMSARDLIAGI